MQKILHLSTKDWISGIGESKHLALEGSVLVEKDF